MYRVATILAAASILVTTVYVLRAVGRTIMGPPGSSSGHEIPDGTWNEKFAAAVLIAGILAIGIAPFWLNELLAPGTETIIKHIKTAIAV